MVLSSLVEGTAAIVESKSSNVRDAVMATDTNQLATRMR